MVDVRCEHGSAATAIDERFDFRERFVEPQDINPDAADAQAPMRAR